MIKAILIACASAGATLALVAGSGLAGQGQAPNRILHAKPGDEIRFQNFPLRCSYAVGGGVPPSVNCENPYGRE